MGQPLNIFMLASENYYDTRKSLEHIDTNCNAERNIFLLDRFGNEKLRKWAEKLKIPYYSAREAAYAESIHRIMQDNTIEGDMLLLPAECWILPDCIEKLQSIMEKEQDVAVVYSSAMKGGEYAAVLSAASEDKDNSWEWTFTCFPAVPALISGERYREYGPFDEEFRLLGQALLDFSITCYSHGKKVLRGINAYIYGSKEMTQSQEEREMYEKDGLLLKKKWGSNYFALSANPYIMDLVQETSAPVKVLEVGCDLGGNLLGVKNKCPNAELYGVEINPAAAKIAAGVLNVQVANIEEKSVDFGGTRFDYIIFADVLEHLREPVETLIFCKQFLKKGGKLLACIPNLMHYSVLESLIDGYFTYMDEGLLDRTHIHFFTYYELIRAFEQAGYRIEQINARVVQVLQERDKAFIDSLIALSSQSERFMYETYQYLVLAEIEEN